MSRIIPELLSPAGGFEAMVAAVQNGADAVYLGAGGFNARQSADNFGGGLNTATAYCHQRGTKVYVTLNTVVRSDEFNALEDTIEEICSSGADGVIVQDIGVARMVHAMAPSLPLHASTQMAVHNPQGVEFLAKQGFRRVVLARELSYEEIHRCAGLGAELEVFVHGALCVACSGQCLLSSLIGGRSGNRGRCAQPCRMVYETGGRSGYLISTRDLCSLEHFDELIGTGAASLKIEGRLKRPEYVALTTQVYRAALDAYRDEKPFDPASATEELRQMFNRGGFTQGYGPGVVDTELMYPAQPNHVGLEIGVSRRDGEVLLNKETDGRDTLVLRRNGEDIPVSMGGMPSGTAKLREARRGDKLFRLTSEKQMSAMRRSYDGENRRIEASARLELHVGKAAKLALSDGMNNVEVVGEDVARAESRPADPERIRAQLCKTGDTPFELVRQALDVDADAFMPVSALNALRREATEKLLEVRSGHIVECRRVPLPEADAGRCEDTRLNVQSSDPAILLRALAAGADAVTFEPDDLREEALERALAALPERFALALPPVASEADLERLHEWALRNAGRVSRVYLSNIAQFDLEWPFERIADYMLNTANGATIEQLRIWGADGFTPSVELNRAQIKALGGAPELIVYGRLPLMQLRHCPLRATRGLKGAHSQCRRCDHAENGDRLCDMALTDRTGAAFPLRRLASDEGCIIRLCNSACLMLLRRASSLPHASAWRLLIEKDEDVETLVRLHRMALDGGDATRERAFYIFDDMKTTTGHYYRGVE